jgi:transposase
MKSFGVVSLRESKISEEIMFSREKARPKIVELARGMKVEAFEHLQNSSKSEEVKISRGGATAVVSVIFPSSAPVIL